MKLLMIFFMAGIFQQHLYSYDLLAAMTLKGPNNKDICIMELGVKSNNIYQGTAYCDAISTGKCPSIDKCIASTSIESTNAEVLPAGTKIMCKNYHNVDPRTNQAMRCLCNYFECDINNQKYYYDCGGRFASEEEKDLETIATYCKSLK